MRRTKIVPAIDLIDGRCVRLRKGNFGQQEIVGENPVEIARSFCERGFSRLHLVDLSGARQGRPQHLAMVKAITDQTSLSVDFSGGLRTTTDIEAAFDAGASQVVIGSAAVLAPDEVVRWLGSFGGDKIILGLDVLAGEVRIKGWEAESGLTFRQVVESFRSQGLTKIMSTEISRDGMLQGPATTYYRELCTEYPGLSIIASGGVATAQDIQDLAGTGVEEIIVGKALYSGSLDLTKVEEFVW
jgi:phosphoribosylformimino-5-aminoimidazole carboxamide ribotide isomerase